AERLASWIRVPIAPSNSTGRRATTSRYETATRPRRVANTSPGQNADGTAERRRAELEAGHPLQLAHAVFDLAACEPDEPVGTKLLDVERGDGRRMCHRLAKQVVRNRLFAVRRDVAEKAAGEGIACAGRIDNGF